MNGAARRAGSRRCRQCRTLFKFAAAVRALLFRGSGIGFGVRRSMVNRRRRLAFDGPPEGPGKLSPGFSLGGFPPTAIAL
jgi:hypothetical protein